MLMSSLHQKLHGPWLAVGLTSIALALATPLRAQVIWEPVSEQQAQQDEILVPMPGESNSESIPEPVVWKPLPPNETKTTDETNAIVSVSYTHLTLPTNREV